MFTVQLEHMATAPTTPRRSFRRRLMPVNTYTPFVLNPSAPPYGLWLDLPFRTRGSTDIRGEAKRRGARFVPNAVGKWKWWIPANMLTAETVKWLNDAEMIRGQRNAPAFNANAMQWWEINNAHPFRLWLAVPFADKDTVKGMGAKFCGESKKWYFDNKTLTENIFNEMIAKQWAHSYNGHVGSNGLTGVYFSAPDLGEVSAAKNPPAASAPVADQRWAFTRDSSMLLMVKRGNSVTIDCNGVRSEDRTDYTRGRVTSLDDARSVWNLLVSNGWVVQASTWNETA